MIASQTSVRGTGSRRVCVLGAWTLCREDGIAIQRAKDGRVGVNTLREHATSVQARRNSHHLLPSLPPPLLQQALPLSRSTSDMHRWARARAAPSSTRISAPPIIVGRVQLVCSASRVRLLREDTRKSGCGPRADRHCRLPVSEREGSTVPYIAHSWSESSTAVAVLPAEAAGF